MEAYNEREEREFFRTGIICSVIANVNSGKGKKFKPEDFMPKRDNKKKQRNDMLEAAKAWTAVMGGEVKQ